MIWIKSGLMAPPGSVGASSRCSAGMWLVLRLRRPIRIVQSIQPVVVRDLEQHLWSTWLAAVHRVAPI